MKKRLFNILQIGNKDDIISRGFDIFIVIVILSNISALFLETFSELDRFTPIFVTIEYLTTIVFCIEYALRIYTATYLYPKETEKHARLHFLVSYDGIIDLFTIIPVFFLSGFVAFRMLRVVRIFHLFRINAQYDSFNVIVNVLYERRNQIMSSVFIIIVLMLSSSLCMYSAEHDVQPGVFRNAFSGIWWSASAVLTVGYGDIYPVTTMGRLMAIIISFLGVGVVAIPTGIISAGFVEQYHKTQQSVYQRAFDVKDIIEFRIDDSVAGSTIGSIKDRDEISIYMVIRGDLTIVPRDDVTLQKGDVLVGRIEKK